MTLIPPVVGPITTDLLGGGFFRQYTDIAPFTYRAGMTYASELEALRVWTFRTLVPFLNDNFTELEDAWVDNVMRLTSAINDGLAAQTADNAQKIADALAAIAEADIPITDPGVLAVLNSPTTGTRVWLDNQYQARAHASKNALTGWWHVDEFGAKGDGATQDHAAIQAAIDAANTEYLATGIIQRVYFGPRLYLVGVVDYRKDDGTLYGITSLLLKDGVELEGSGVVKTRDGAYGAGALYALVRSKTGGVSNAGIRRLTLNANKTGNIASTQAGAVQLEALNNVWVLDCTVPDANGNGIMVRGTTTRLATNLRIEGNSVTNAGNIGIQASQFDGLMITNNRVADCHDNGIDVYGEDGSTSTHAYNFTISNNRIKNCGNGIFLETVSRGITTENRIQNSAGGEGIHVNRINGQPNRLTISNNHVVGGVAGVGGTGDMGGVTIRNNEFEDFNSAGVLLGGAGNISNFYILNNTMNGNADTTPKVLVKAGTNQVVNLIHRGTITLSRNRTVDTVNMGPAAVTSTWTPALSPGDTITTQ